MTRPRPRAVLLALLLVAPSLAAVPAIAETKTSTTTDKQTAENAHSTPQREKSPAQNPVREGAREQDGSEVMRNPKVASNAEPAARLVGDESTSPAQPSKVGWAALATAVAASILGAIGIRMARSAKRRAEDANWDVDTVRKDVQRLTASAQLAAKPDIRPRSSAAVAATSAINGDVALEGRVAALERALEGLQEKLADRQRGLAPLGEDLPSSPRPEPPPVYPATVDDLRERFGPGTKVAWKPVTGLLHEDPSGDADSVVEIEGNLVYLPVRGRMASAADYRTYFERFFACGAPSRGTVEIALPALVERTGDGRFKLVRQGEIRIQ